MGNTVCTDALPPNFHDVLGGSPAIDMTTFQKMVDSVMVQHTHSRTNTGVDVAAAADAVASEGSSEAAATSVAAPWNAYSHVEHNIKAYRLVHRGPPYSARRVKSDVGDGTSVNADELRQRTASGKSSNCGMSTSSAFTPRGGSARTTIKPLPLSALNFTYKRPYATPDPLVSSLLSDPSAANAVEIEPVVLSRPHVAEMKSTETYLVLHIQRVRSTDIGPRTSAHSSSASPLTPHAEDSPTADAAVPSWATEMLNLFTPRGLAVPFASDLERPTVDLRRGRHFRYSLHLLSGRRAHPLVPAVAVLYAIQLEQALNEHPMLLAQLFFNCGGASPSSISPRAVCSTSATGDATPRMGQPRGGALQSEPTSPATIGRIIVEGVTVLESGRNNSLASSPVLSSSLSASAAMDVYARNAVLRVLHGIRNIRGGFPNSGRLSSFGGTPRSGAPTPRSAAGQPKGAAAFRLPSAYQSPSGVVIPPLPLSDESHRSRFHFFDTRKVPPQNSGHTQQSVATSRGSARGRPEGHTTDTRPGPSPADSARDEAIPRTAPIAGMKPLSFQNLGLAGESHNNTPPMAIPSLQLKPKSFGTAASAAPNDTDEREAYEERALRLKLAAPEATEVLPYLFVGGEEAARDRAQLRAKGVTAIVNTVAFDIPNLFPHQFSYLPLYVCDSPDEPIFSLFPLVNAFIESTKEAGGKVMIHCHQGVSRSCSLVIAYLIWKQGVTYDRAYDLVRAKRNICSPNAGFYVNLGLWEKHLSHPSLNKAYALVPYSTTYAFPFTYRLAALFRGPGGNPHAEEDSCNVINAHTQVISDQKPLRIDKRLCYGFMLRDASSTASGLRLSSYFYVDQSSGMHQVLIERAKAQWEQLVLHDFYREEPHKSLNNNGVTVDFVPVKFLPLSAPTKLITSADELGEVLHKHRLSKKKTGAVKLTTRDPLWGDLPDTQEMLANGTTTSAHPSSRVEDAEGSSAEQSGTARKRAREAALNVGVGSQDELPIARPSMKALAIPSAAGVHNNPQEGSLSDVVVYEFPFDQPALTDVIGMADLRLDQAYAVVAPPTVCGSDTDGACRVFLWVGHDFPLHEGDVLDAYEGNLVVNDPSLGQEHVNALEGFHRVSLDGEVVMAFVVGGGLVQEGEEPDELLLELD